ncbi:MAG: DUF4159 domain-containing protein, partial [Rhodospirillaceae bacterium]|nr:DUF4159 domain-containing protein [Rhodospirillaceae bacterium]
LRLVAERESPARIPPWLLVLRLLLAASLVAAVMQPLINAETRLFGSGPLYVIVDDDWASAQRWPARLEAMRGLIDHAGRSGRSVALVRTAPTPKGVTAQSMQLMAAADARSMLERMQPRPWRADRRATIQRLLEWAANGNHRPGDVVWLSSGLEAVDAPKTDTMDALTRRLRRLGSVRVMSEPAGRLSVILRPPENAGKAMVLRAERPAVTGDALTARGLAALGLAVRALDDEGQVLTRVPLVFADGETKAEAKFELPTELRNRLVRLEVAGIAHVGAVVLVDERWRRRPVGLLGSASVDQPLLDARHYLRQALSPFTEIRLGSVAQLMQRPLAVMVMPDGELPAPVEQAALKPWLDKGGILVRFAGPNLARDAGTMDQLLPVRIRRGNRVIGGALSWRKPETLAPFAESSPFHGIVVPEDVRVRRQVLAEPSLDLADKTWARLSDGTPLVTAERRGQGWLVLVHTTADGTWTDLSFSGVYVNMLRRLVDLSQGVTGGAGGLAAPVANLDAFGRLGDPPGGATAISPVDLAAGKVGPANPPGFYGDTRLRRALNLGAGLPAMAALGDLPSGVARSGYSGSSALDLRPWLLAFAAMLFLVDTFFSLHMRGLLRFGRGVAVMLLASLSWLGAASALAQDADALSNSLETRLAYVLTGNSRIDEISRAGLTGLTTILWRRTAAELGKPRGVDPETDELAFFPLLYWPVIANAGIGPEATERVRAYLRSGGTILFDTRDQTDDGGSMRELARRLALPALVPVDAGHVLTRSFYLLREFPGRWAGGALWVEKAGERVNDGVSPVIAGSHDWAAAWAMDEAQRPLFAVVPGGERQREMAFRFGINLVMYTLTGNYKADQVHMPAIIRRLGQ